MKTFISWKRGRLKSNEYLRLCVKENEHFERTGSRERAISQRERFSERKQVPSCRVLQ